jgi:S-methylmethionine-dependent homocysteine/selenocysteine methylase
MSRYRGQLPQLDQRMFLTDSGLETTLIFHDGYDLPHFAAFVLLDDEKGRERLDRYFREHAQVAAGVGAGVVLESVTWRASPDWAELLGLSSDQLADANRAAIDQLDRLRAGMGDDRAVVVSGCIGPRGDGYDGTARMDAHDAEEYHAVQVRTFADSPADMVHAMTITYPDEAIGIVEAARHAGIPVAVSFTVETDGRLPDGAPLGEAIQRVDEGTDGSAAYFGVNCAHPTHLDGALDGGAPWAPRLRGLRANASRKSHAELDEAESLDDGDPDELGREYVELRREMPGLTVLGGCCGTDVRHVRSIAAATTAEP